MLTVCVCFVILTLLLSRLSKLDFHRPDYLAASPRLCPFFQRPSYLLPHVNKLFANTKVTSRIFVASVVDVHTSKRPDDRITVCIYLAIYNKQLTINNPCLMRTQHPRIS